MKYSLLLALLVTSVFSQVQTDEKHDQIEALKIELEEARRLRDRVISKRWEDRRKYVEAREKFNSEYDALKETLELTKLDEDRIREQQQTVQRDIEELKAAQDGAQTRFALLSSLPIERGKEISEYLEKKFPARIPQRQERLNSAIKNAEAKRDSPSDVLQTIVKLYLEELHFTRQIVSRQTEMLMSDQTPGQGTVLRVGTVASARMEEKTNRVELLLQDPGSPDKRFFWRQDLPPEVTQNLSGLFGNLSNTSHAGPLMLPVDVLLNKSVQRTYTVEEQKTLAAASVDYFRSGGIFMWPLLCIPIVALLLILERFVYWMSRRQGGRKNIESAIAKLEKGESEASLKECEKHPRSSVFKVLKSIAESTDKERELAEKNVQETMLHEIPLLEKRLTTISVLGAAAPLLGLLGTVTGLISMFDTITLHGTNDPKLLAGGISQALVTTQTGLVIAIPIMLVHNFMSNRVSGLIGEMEKYASRALNLVWPNG